MRKPSDINSPVTPNFGAGLSISEMIRAQRHWVPSQDSVEFIKTQVQQKISLNDLEEWLHKAFERAERDKDYRLMAMYSKTNDLLSNILIQYTMDVHPGRVVWLDPKTGEKVS